MHDRLKQKLKQSKIKGLALDIDDTLSQTLRIWFENVIRIEPNPEDLSVDELLEKYRLFQEIPYWQTEEIWSWINEAINSNEFQETIPLVEGVESYIKQIERVIPIVGYITSRPVGVQQGTQKWLNNHALPKAELISRPEDFSHESGSEWKAGVLVDLFPYVKGIVDDNPSLVDALPESYEGTIFLYGRADYKLEKDLDVVICPSWKDVVKAVNKCFS